VPGLLPGFRFLPAIPWRIRVKNSIDILRESASFYKFCSKNDKAFGCKKAFGCYLSCPLWLAREAQYLANEKGMTLGEAHRACLRAYISAEDSKAIVKEAVINAMDGKPEYGRVKNEDDKTPS
jgi:hypothetical protein